MLELEIAANERIESCLDVYGGLEAVAPHLHVGHEAYEFIAELLRPAPQQPNAITKTLQSMIAGDAPEYGCEDRVRSLLEFLAAHGQRDAIITEGCREAYLAVQTE